MTESQNPDFAPEQAAEVSREGVSGVGARLRVAREMRQMSVTKWRRR